MNWIFGVTVGVILARLMVQLTFERLNRAWAAAHREVVPVNLRDMVTPEAHAKSAEYTMEHSRLSSQELMYGTFIKLAVLASGVLPFVYNGTLLNFGAQNFWAQALMMSAVSMVVGVFFWPFEWKAIFGIEAKYGFNRQTPWGWFSDEMKGLALGLVMTVPLMAGVLWMVYNVKLWWMWAFIVLTAYELVLTWVYPNYIAPLFNKFTPLEEGKLKERLSALAKKADVSVRDIYVMDGSRRSSHANAYFTGFGGSRRIVLYDTLIAQLDEEEIAAVLAHEIGHLKHKHVLRQLYVGSAWQLLGLFLTNELINWNAFYNAFGLDITGGVAGAFLLLSFVGGAFSFWWVPMMSQWYRQHEYEADKMAAALVGSPVPLITGLRKMTKESLGSIDDHPLSHAFYASHPTLEEREKALGMVQETAEVVHVR